MRLLVCLVLSTICVIVGPEVAGAVRWTDEPPTVVVNEQLPYEPRTYCPTFYQTVAVIGQGEHSACVFIGSQLSLANYRVSGQPRVAIKFPYQDSYSALAGVCERYWGCVYSGEGDVLVEHQLIDGKVAPVVYPGFSARLRTSFPFSYGFDASNPAVPFKDTSIPKFGLSANGRWLVGELKGSGIALADLKLERNDTLSVTGNLYGRGFDPQMELAVSNDGRSVLAVGVNVGVRLYGIDSDCLSHQACPSTDVQIGTHIASFRSAHSPRFDEAGHMVKLALVSRSAPSRLLVLSRAADTQRLEYLALGDSFTSGEGETDERYYEPLTNTTDNSCHVSRRSYPYLLGPDSTKSVACAGATIDAILGEVMYPNSPLGAALDLIPGSNTQTFFLEQAQPVLATIGIGGNDAGLIAKLKACVMPGICHWVSPGGLRATAQEIGGLFGRLIAMYQALISRSPATQFVAIGYPLAVDLSGSCDTLTGWLLSPEERTFMNESLNYLNRVIQAAATTVGIGFIDTGRFFEGHALCSGNAPPAMNGLRIGSDIAPIKAMPRLKLISSSSFHPTPFGHSLLALGITASHDNIFTYAWCENGKKVCARPTDTSNLSDYWPTDPSAAVYRYTRLVERHAPGDRLLQVETPDWFRPETFANLTIRSEVTEVGKYQVGEDRRVTATVEAPPHLEEGFHTLMLSGESVDGVPLVLYQEIVVQDPASESVPEMTVDAASGSPSSPPSSPAASRVEIETPIVAADKSSGITGVLGNQTEANATRNSGLVWLPVGAILVLAVYLSMKWRRIAYNGTMASIRTIVKKLIPRSLFRKIEPLGHLFEAILMNVRYGFPARKMRIIGVTGTNGKTTTSFMIHRLLHESGVKVGLLTTVANGIGDDIIPQAEHITTAQAGILQRRLRDYARKGVEWVVVETSSHALAQYRVWGIPYEVAVMTNITHEHLDYHGTFKNYVEAKRRLFKIANRNGLRFGAVNAQDPSANKFSKTVANHTTYGIGEGDLQAQKVKLSANGSRYQAVIDADTYDIKVNIPGEFNVSNSLAAVAVGRKIGLTKTQIENGIAALRSVEGRMNVIDEGQPFKVIVDFASTPDAFERLFESVRPLTKGKLIAVFGSAGRRDEAKRPVQGEIAARSADIVVLTEEDDRDIDGNQILREIAKGAMKAKKKEGKDLFLILNREEAIGFAMIQATSKDDVVVLLGKGHEHTIERADGEYPWNEADVARAALQALKKSSRS